MVKTILLKVLAYLFCAERIDLICYERETKMWIENLILAILGAVFIFV